MEETLNTEETMNLSEELVFEKLEERAVPSVWCGACSTSCDCSSTSCVVTS